MVGRISSTSVDGYSEMVVPGDYVNHPEQRPTRAVVLRRELRDGESRCTACRPDESGDATILTKKGMIS